jgi:serine/threonine-protein kinase
MDPLCKDQVLALRYRIVRPLGCGGMAHVYEATHMGLHKRVALKVLDADTARSVTGVRFEREAQTAARLAHPGCIRVLDYGRWVDHTRFLAMELLHGPTLRAVLAEQGRLSEQRALYLVAEVLKALAHAHGTGVLHRDIKPENIMFRRPDSVAPVLIDFGLARLWGESPLTAAGACFGSPSYMAPERLLGRYYDGRADIYSTGILLYELLAGSRPFSGDDPLDIAQQQVRRPAPPLAAHGVHVGPALARILDRALAKDPARRYADAESMLGAVDQAIAEAGARATPPPVPVVDDHIPTARLPVLPQPLRKRTWGWLRYGSWRWPARSTSRS